MRRVFARALHPIVPLTAAAVILAAYLAGQVLRTDPQPFVTLYGEVVDGTTLTGKSCHDLAYPKISCFDTPEEMFDDQIRGWPNRAGLLQEHDKPAYLVYRGVRRPLSDLEGYAACNALTFPEIRCFDSEREALLDRINNFPDKARAARIRLAELEGDAP